MVTRKKSVPVIFEPPCIYKMAALKFAIQNKTKARNRVKDEAVD